MDQEVREKGWTKEVRRSLVRRRRGRGRMWDGRGELAGATQQRRRQASRSLHGIDDDVSHVVSDNPNKSTQHKSIVAKHVEASIMNDRTPGRQSQPSDSLPDSLPRSVARDVTTCPRHHSLEPSHTHPCSNASPKKTSVTSSFPTFPRGMETTPAASPRSFKECSTRPTTRN